MALTDENGSGFMTTMPVAPMYGGGYGGGFGNFGGDWGWIVLLLLLAGNGGWGMGGFGGGMLGIDFPWLMSGQQGINSNTNAGFANAFLNDGVMSVRDGISDISTQLCGGFAGVNANIANGFAQAEIGENARQMASMNQMFGLQSQLADCCCENRLASADLKYTIATENAADRFEALNNTRDIIDAQNRGTQAVLDKLCALELDGVKSQLAQAQRDNVGLQNQLNMANLAASQTAQTATVVDNIYNRLSTCPVGTVPVYGEQPIFTCGGGSCGCGNNF